MWDVFPILCDPLSDDRFELKTIKPGYKYTRFPEVLVEYWYDVPKDVKKWCETIWADEFGCMRNPLSTDDLLAWIPNQGTLIARNGRWVDDTKSKPMVYISCNYVHPEMRGYRLAEKMINSIAVEACNRWNNEAFLFEIREVPKSLKMRGAIPVARFDYLWIPSSYTDDKWEVIRKKDISNSLFRIKGFHPSSFGDCKGYRHTESKRIVILDSHDDVVYYDSVFDLYSLPNSGHYVRMFSSTGAHHYFIENMYFRPAQGRIISV